MAVSFAANILGPCLRANAATEVQKQMLSAAADHWYLLGYMAVDEVGVDGLARRYYVQALRLAERAGDRLTYSQTLRGMSVQTLEWGNPRNALPLAMAACENIERAGPRMRAFLLGQLAHSAAEVGDRRRALDALRQTEAAMDQAESRPSQSADGSAEWADDSG